MNEQFRRKRHWHATKRQLKLNENADKCALSAFKEWINENERAECELTLLQEQRIEWTIKLLITLLAASTFSIDS